MKPIVLTIMILCSLLTQAQRDTVKSNVFQWKNMLVDKDSASYRIQYLNGPTTNLSELEIHATELDPGKSPYAPSAFTDYETLIVVKEGIVKVTTQGNNKFIGPGGVVLIMPGDVHEILNTGKEVAIYFVMKFKSKGAVNLARAKEAGGSFIGDWDMWSLEENDKGERRSVFDRFTSMFRKMEMHVTALNAGVSSHQPHKHPQEEILLIRKGNGQVVINDKVYMATTGDLVFFASGSMHAIKNVGKDPLEYFALQYQ
jgi:(S)-ureidoglycine aminohydrolase